MTKTRRGKLHLVLLPAILGALFLCVIFPNKYGNEIAIAAEQFGLDEALVRAVVLVESRYDKNAVSVKGAKGLMQLMPDTFEDAAAAIGKDPSNVFDPLTNIMCGCYYLREQLNRFGNTDYALMAYNAGPKNAERFIAGEPIFAETAEYVKRVNAAIDFYSLFY